VLATRDCTVGASGVEFGLYDTLTSTPTDATGSITYACTQGNGTVNVVISIDRGRSGSFNRAMSSGLEQMSYNLYLDVGHTQIWGDGSSGTTTLQDKVPGNNHPVTATVYGRVFPQQNVGNGRYTDALTVTLQF
jgi:spore coat protein U-like protein